MDQADFPGDTIGYINFAPFLIGTPVIDTYQLKLAVPGVHHTDKGAKRQIGVCRCEGFGVEALAIGGFSILYTLALPLINFLHSTFQMCTECSLSNRGVHLTRH